MCGQTKLTSEFYVRNKKTGLLRTECKECIRARQREYNRTHPAPDRREYQRRWRENNRERERARHRRRNKTAERRAYSREWRAKNHRKRLAYERSHRQRHPEKARAATRRWKARNPDAVRRSEERQARIRSRPGARLNDAVRAWWRVLNGDPCVYCGARTGLTIEHIEPVAADGDSHWSNIAPACGTCNSSKGPKRLLEFLLYRLEAA